MKAAAAAAAAGSSCATECARDDDIRLIIICCAADQTIVNKISRLNISLICVGNFYYLAYILMENSTRSPVWVIACT